MFILGEPKDLRDLLQCCNIIKFQIQKRSVSIKNLKLMESLRVFDVQSEFRESNSENLHQ